MNLFNDEIGENKTFTNSRCLFSDSSYTNRIKMLLKHPLFINSSSALYLSISRYNINEEETTTTTTKKKEICLSIYPHKYTHLLNWNKIHCVFVNGWYTKKRKSHLQKVKKWNEKKERREQNGDFLFLNYRLNEQKVKKSALLIFFLFIHFYLYMCVLSSFTIAELANI